MNSPLIKNKESKNSSGTSNAQFKSFSPQKNPEKSNNNSGSKAPSLDHIELIWKDINIVYQPEKKSRDTPKTIIHPNSGKVSSGEFLALMGATGSGKTTFLNYLSGRLVSKNLTQKGKIILNNECIDNFEDFNDIIGYVIQEDIVLETLTPRETLFFSAKFKLSLSDEECNKRVNDLISELELSRCENTRIGSVLSRGISGGERKRTCIAIELISDPKILFLDEPTTGLDSFTALKVVELLRKEKDMGRIIISTIHQPSTEIFDCFDKLMLLYEGHCVYHADANKVVPYFTERGYDVPKFSNPAEFIMKVLRPKAPNEEEFKELAENDKNMKGSFHGDQEMMKLCNFYREEYEAQFSSINVDKLSRIQGLKAQKKRLGVFEEFYLLLKRSSMNLIRHPSELKLKLMTTMFVIFFSLALFFNLSDNPNSFEDVQNRYGLLFFVAMIIGNMSYESVLLTFNVERPLFIKEQTSKMYSVDSYFWARNLCELPLQVILPFFFTPCMYFGCNMNYHSPTPFFNFIFITIANGLACESLGLITATLTKSIEQAAVLSPVFILPMMLFAGFFVKQDSIPVILIPFKYLSIFKYSFQAYVQNEFDGLAIQTTETYEQGTVLSIIILLVLAVGFRTIAYFIMKFYTARMDIFKKS